ncbi:MAG: ferrous iron transporter B [Bacteroidetes bacterium]|nr:ferrous iron transporter B [Bacteroidota bacterium]MBU2584065.1 ferrous iron transporter B [Bacteroidota bacterium]
MSTKELQIKNILEIIDQADESVRESVSDDLVESIYTDADKISKRAIIRTDSKFQNFDVTLDRILTSKYLGFPVMLLLLAGVFFLTITGANYPSKMIADGLFWFAGELKILFHTLHSPWWFTGFLIDGVYSGLAWVIAVMLPPMAIFFPIFTFLEDAGYLPRVAFNLDRLFKWSGAHGKQALTMGMGFGCNAAGVVSTRIIDSPRERLIAIITNNFVPCNGRWPTIIMLASVFVAASFPEKISAVVAASTVVGVTLFGVLVTLIVSKFLSTTVLKGEASTFKLELPPYRKPQILRILYRSLIDRTIFVLGRAIVMAAPAGGLIWLLGNIHIDGVSLMAYAVNVLQPVGKAIGLDGVILLAYIIAIPANEIIIPTIIMAYSASTRMMELEMDQLKELFLQNEWTILTAISLMFFSLLHYPCSTTTWTIWKETKSIKWTLISNILPLAIAFLVCFVIYRVGLIFL